MRTNNGQILYIPKIGQRADFQHPLMRGCVGWWPLTDGGGGIAKDIVGTNDGTLTNSPSWVSSSIGSAIKFTETNPNKNVSLTSTLLGTTHTISFWASQYYDGNVLGGDGGPTGGDSKIYMSSSGLKYTADGWGGGTTSAPPVKAGRFHVCVVRSSTTTDWYLDGVFFQQKSFTSSTRQFELASIGGADISSWNGYSGTVQNVRIWNRALSATEVLELYTNPWAGLSMPSATRYFFVPQLITASPKLFSVSGSSVSMRSNVGRVSVRAAR